MKALLVLLCYLLFASTVLAQPGDIGKQIGNSHGDLPYLTDAMTADGCVLGWKGLQKHLFCVPGHGGGNSGGGTILTPSGVSMIWGYFEETLQTSAGQPYVESVGNIPGGAIVQRCLSKTTVTVNGGYWFGTNGAEDLYGRLPGVLGESNLLDDGWPGPGSSYHDHHVRISGPQGANFPDSLGFVRITCIFSQYAVP